MKRLSNGRSSRKTRPARDTEHSYEPEDDDITTQKVKFASLYEEDDDEAVAEEEEGEEEEDDDEEEEEAGYALRQKHRKIWKVSSNKHGGNNQHQQQQQQQQQKFICSKCGKGFQSLKAKCGHMASHSEKEKAPSNNHAAKHKLAMDSQSDTESGAQQLTRRSRRTRYKKHNSVSVVDSKAMVDVYKNCSSEDSGVEQEQEEVAISLMMLSRDPANWGGLNSVGDSSDNNSVVLEARSISTKLAQKDGLRSGYPVDVASKKCASKKVTALGDSESGFASNGAKNVDTEVKVKNLRKRKFDEGLKTEPHLSLKKLKRVMDARLKHELIRDGEGYTQIERPEMDLYLKKSLLNSAGYNVENQYSNTEIMYQKFEHKALIHSQFHQAFIASAENHKSFTAASPYVSGENSFEIDASLDMHKGKGILEHNLSNVGDKWKKGKHECPVCSKVFRSGQALGGHRRVHLAEGSDEIKSNEIAANFKRSGTQFHDFIDLNLPAPMEDDEANESMASYR